ncbi:MAG: response regulator [Candidatus Nitrosotenuis sp.]|nr:MAG: response regulator [Candidatus Nitrosotenuis sp.]
MSTVGSAGETGSGFGLPLAKDIMLLHGGDLEAACELGKGCTFTLKVPYVRPRILVVDDDPAFRFLLTQILRKVDADLAEAEDGVEAADMLAEGKELPHLIISDIEMPRMTGLELLANLQNRHETQAIPVIIISGKHGMEIRDTVYSLGGKDFLTKQLDIDDFIPRVRRFIA